jgi:hypothetical protein
MALGPHRAYAALKSNNAEIGARWSGDREAERQSSNCKS